MPFGEFQYPYDELYPSDETFPGEWTVTIEVAQKRYYLLMRGSKFRSVVR